uniref:B30.2/SPRY domain-containing protein n=1 Tax=Panagrellus redivivus TaxID=6233 RepID=A0A7E4V380_PANRE
MFVQPDGFTIFRRPVAQCSDAVRGKRGIKEGVHAFDFIWHTPFGTSAAIGLSTKAQHLKCSGYLAFLGASENSWSWDIVEGYVQWAGDLKPYPTNPNSPPVQVGQRLRMIVDCDRQLVGFERGTEFLGIAFKNLPRDVLVYPTISAVYGQTEVSMYYMGPPVMG